MPITSIVSANKSNLVSFVVSEYGSLLSFNNTKILISVS